MSTKQQIEKKVKSINAAITPFDTGETWIDDTGNKYSINRAPNGWAYTGYIDDILEEVEKQ